MITSKIYKYIISFLYNKVYCKILRRHECIIHKRIVTLRTWKSAESLMMKMRGHENETEKSPEKECGITAERYQTRYMQFSCLSSILRILYCRLVHWKPTYCKRLIESKVLLAKIYLREILTNIYTFVQ